MAMDTHTDAFRWLDLTLDDLAEWIAAKVRVYERTHPTDQKQAKRRH